VDRLAYFSHKNEFAPMPSIASSDVPGEIGAKQTEKPLMRLDMKGKLRTFNARKHFNHFLRRKQPRMASADK
jgi:hypothetical protein